MTDIDKTKLDKMWTKILAYEKGKGMTESDKTSVSELKAIIDEVMKECL